MAKLTEKKSTTDWLILANVLAAAVLLNMLASLCFFRWDLTEEKRFTIKPQTKELLKNLDEDVFIEVFLEGELNPSFKRFRNSIRETLNEFKVYSNRKVSFAFTNPAAAKGGKAQQEFMSALMSKGIQPTNVIESKGGKREEQIIFPGALVSAGVSQRGVQLLKGSRVQGAQEAINQSIENVEFELAQAIYSLTNLRPKKIGIVTGHGELDSLAMDGFLKILKELFSVSHAQLTNPAALKPFRVLIIAKPTQPFSDAEKYNLDQFILKGGRVLFLIDRLEADMKQVSHEGYLAMAYNTQLEDQLFRYGVRVNAGFNSRSGVRQIPDGRGANGQSAPNHAHGLGLFSAHHALWRPRDYAQYGRLRHAVYQQPRHREGNRHSQNAFAVFFSDFAVYKFSRQN